MTPFIILFVYLGLVEFTTSNKLDKNKKRKVQAILCGLGLWILMALRSWTCGLDLLYEEKGLGYIPQFISMKYTSFQGALNSDTGYEPGFNILYWIIYHYISTNPQFMLAITSAIEIGLIGYTIYKQSPNITLSYVAFACLGLYIFSYSGLRQGLAVAFTFFAFNFIDDKRPWKFLTIVLLAFTLHRSSFVFLPAYLVRNFSLSRQKAFLGLIVVFAFLPFLMPVIQFFAVLLYGNEKYSIHEGGAYGLFLLYILMFIFSYRYLSLNKVMDRKMMQIRWMCLIAIFLQSSGILSAGALARIAFSYSIFFCLLLPFALSTNLSKIRQTSFFISLLLISFFIYCNKDGYLGVVPYHFFWEESFNL